MLPIVVGLLAFGVIVALALSFGRRRGSIPTRAGVDGFWISTRGMRAGSRIRYGCLVRSSRQYGEVLVEAGPDEIFVYTGNTPSDIRLEALSYGSGRSTTDDDDDDDGVIGTAVGGSFSESSDSSYSGGAGGGSGSSGDYGSSGAAGEASASNAGDGFPPAY
jgi:hypothetical protein